MNRELRGKKSRKPTETVINPKMGQDFFTYLPSEMIMNILSRLPIRSIIRCKCICKSWLDLLATPEFVKSHLSLSKSVEGVAVFTKSHLSKSVEGVAVFTNADHPKPYEFFEFVDKLNLDPHMPRWNTVTLFDSDLPCAEPLHSSTNGLLFLARPGVKRCRSQLDGVMWLRLFICNPITREYITIPCPQESSFSKDQILMDAYGFGVSRISGQYKLVRMIHALIQVTRFSESECQVYTVGTGSWRRIGSGWRLVLCIDNDVGVFLNGNLHWMAHEVEGSSVWISCFDLETEVFSTFSPPPLHVHGSHTSSRVMSALGECLCVCDKSDDGEVVIWLMKEYGDDKSWTKEFIFPKLPPVAYHHIRPIKFIKVFENGDILMAMENRARLLYFTSKTKSIQSFDGFGLSVDFTIRAIMYTPSFVSLKTFAMENVISF